MSCGCGKVAKAAAVVGATAALGPAGTLITSAALESMSKDTSPAGQAQYQAALEHNAVVEKQNAERSSIITQFVQDALGGDIGKDDIVFGDKAIAQLNAVKEKYGPEVGQLTLQEFVDKYPAEARTFITSVGDVFPELRGKSFDQAWAMLPNALKTQRVDDLMAMIPNSSWYGKTATAASAAPVSKAAIGGLAAIAALAFVFLRRK